MTTLKILWKEQQDMRRVQVLAANQTLANHDGRAIADVNTLTFQNLKDYLLLIFPELHAVAPAHVLLYYTDDDEEQVRITNDTELTEAFRLMEEIASLSTKLTTPVVKITVVTTPRAQQAIEADQLPVGPQERKVMDLFVDISKLIEDWDAASANHEVLKRDLVSLLHEPGCQDALTEVMATPKYATLFQFMAAEFHREPNLTAVLRAVASHDEFDQIAKILLIKCPHARLQVERVLQVIQEHRNVQMLSASDVFEAISVEETKEDIGPVIAVFEADVTCPDGTVLAPSQAFDKVWRIKNGGKTKWPVGCKLLCVGGDRLQAPDSVPIPSVQAGSTIDVSLRMITPSQPGRYTGYWRLCTDDGTRFGQRMWVDINVVSPGTTGGEVRIPAPIPVVRSQPGAKVSIPSATPVVSPPVAAPVAVPVAVATPVVAAPAPPPPPVKPTKTVQEIKWESALQALAEMGFQDTHRNIILLEANDGNLTAVITGLL